jgi:hypothetical protein
MQLAIRLAKARAAEWRAPASGDGVMISAGGGAVVCFNQL